MIKMFMRMKISFFSLISMMIIGSLQPNAALADRINLLILAEDWDEDSIPRDNRIDRAAVAKLTDVALVVSNRESSSGRYNFDGFRVYDETAISGNITTGARRSDELLIELARGVDRGRIDVLVLYTLYAENDLRYNSDGKTIAAAKINFQVMARAIDVRSGRALARTSELFSTQGFVDPNCFPTNPDKESYKNCVIREVSDALQNFAGDAVYDLLRDVIRTTYSDRSPNAGIDVDNDDCGRSQEFTIEMEYFTARQLQRFEEEISGWDCMIELELGRAGSTLTEYRLYTGRSENWIKRDIAGAMAVMGLEARVRSNGDLFSVRYEGQL
jgi:hypothetical protein